MQDFINIGYVAGFHGIKGEVKIKSTTDFKDERYVKGKKIYLVNKNETVEKTIESVREHKGFVLVKFEGVTNLNDVEKYKGYEVKVSNEDRLDLADDEFYFFDLVGLDVIDSTNQVIGQVSRIMQTGASEILVMPKDGKEVLIPFVKAIVKDVDMENKKIYLTEIEGLY